MLQPTEDCIAFANAPPLVIISGGVAIIRCHTGRDRAMSVRTFEETSKRFQLALSRYASGETDIIVDD